MFEQGFVIAYAAMAFGGAGFALWAGYEWYMISKRCRVLELALERAIIDSVYSTGHEVWLLLSTAVLTGAAVDGTDQIETRALAYPSREAARDHIREFMRLDVSESKPKGAWDDTETVDDVLDSIFEGNDDLNSDGDGVWTYDGSVRSYEWKLMRLGVRA